MLCRGCYDKPTIRNIQPDRRFSDGPTTRSGRRPRQRRVWRDDPTHRNTICLQHYHEISTGLIAEAIDIARRHPRVCMSDLVQVGWLSVLHALDRYCPQAVKVRPWQYAKRIAICKMLTETQYTDRLRLYENDTVYCEQFLYDKDIA